MCHAYDSCYISVGQHCSSAINRRTGLEIKIGIVVTLGLYKIIPDRELSDCSRSPGRDLASANIKEQVVAEE
jgi:hypothetical protein